MAKPSEVVGSTGWGLFSALSGVPPGTRNLTDYDTLTDLFAGSFGNNSLQDVGRAWNRASEGRFVGDIPTTFTSAAQRARDRFFGNAQTGAPDANQAWANWFNTSYNPQDIPGIARSPYQRALQRYGGFDQGGNPLGALDSPITQALAGVRADQSRSPYLDPMYGVNQLSDIFAGSGGDVDVDAWRRAHKDIEEGSGLSPGNFILQRTLPAQLQTYAGGPKAGEAGQGGITQLQQALAGFKPGEQIGQQGVSQLQQTLAGYQPGGEIGQEGVSQLGDVLGSLKRGAEFGRRGLDRTRNLTNQQIEPMLRNIDRETQLSLAPQLQEIRAALAGSGMGQSGAGQLAVSRANNAAIAESNRRKQELLGQMTESQLGRESGAINLLTQVGAQGAESDRDRMTRAIEQATGYSFQGGQSEQDRLARAISEATGYSFQGGESQQSKLAQAIQQATGMTGDQYTQEMARRGELVRMSGASDAAFAENRRQRATDVLNMATQSGIGVQEAQRQRQAAALEGGLGRRASWMEQGGNLALQGLLGADQQMLARQQAEANAQSQGLADYMRMFGQREDFYGNRMQQTLSLSDQVRAMQNERLQQQLYYQMLPLNVLLQMATGISPSPGPAGRVNPLTAGIGQGLGQAIGNIPSAAVNYFGGGSNVSQATPNWWE